MFRIPHPVHPGEILREEYLLPLGLTPYALAKALDVPRTRIERLARGETAVTTDTALRLARYFGTSPDMWMNLQVAFDLTNDALAKAAEIDRIVPRAAAAAQAA